jgi:hypothetical protein
VSCPQAGACMPEAAGAAADGTSCLWQPRPCMCHVECTIHCHPSNCVSSTPRHVGLSLDGALASIVSSPIDPARHACPPRSPPSLTPTLLATCPQAGSRPSFVSSSVPRRHATLQQPGRGPAHHQHSRRRRHGTSAARRRQAGVGEGVAWCLCPRVGRRRRPAVMYRARVQVRACAGVSTISITCARVFIGYHYDQNLWACGAVQGHVGCVDDLWEGSLGGA